MKPKTMNFISWPIRILLAAAFLLAGMSKVSGNPAILDMFQDWGYSPWFCTLIGILEIGGAILLVIPKTTFYGSAALMVIMIGALITHLLHDPIGQLLRPIIFMCFLTINMYLWKKINIRKE